MDKRKLAVIEEYVLGVFRGAGTARLLAREFFDRPGGYANADLVRAFEDLEKRQRLLVRHTEEGSDWGNSRPRARVSQGFPTRATKRATRPHSRTRRRAPPD